MPESTHLEITLPLDPDERHATRCGWDAFAALSYPACGEWGFDEGDVHSPYLTLSQCAAMLVECE